MDSSTSRTFHSPTDSAGIQQESIYIILGPYLQEGWWLEIRIVVYFLYYNTFIT